MKKILLIFTLFTGLASLAQGVSTSSIGGRVLDEQGAPLLGSNIVVTNINTGVVYGVVSDDEGYYRISGLKPGGPYKLEISYTGFENFIVESIYLQLGQTERFNPELTSSLNALEEVVVTGVDYSSKTGNETYVNREKIDALPQATRSLGEFVRTTPFAQLEEGNDGFEISIAGQNNRYNTIYIDGAVNNDVFGLAGSGTNGGQTGVNPISLDAIESFQVQISPFDVKVGGFVGGSINAVTRSGSNNFEASAYTYIKNEGLAGKDSWDTNEKLPEFNNLLYGVRLGGALIQNKLFYFLNYERQDDETPNPWNAANYAGDLGAGINNFAQQIQSAYGYDPGTLTPNSTVLESDKLNIKLDLNASENDNLSLAFRYTEANNVEARTSNDFNARYLQGSEAFVSKNTNLTFNWNHQTSKLNNSLVISLNTTRDDRDPLNDDAVKFPRVRIQDGAGRIEFGSEPYSTSNLLDQDIFTITNNLEIYKGKHTITIGTHNEFYSSTNLFIRQNYGDYFYDSPQGFLDNNPDELDSMFRSYSLLTDALGDEAEESAAVTDYAQIGFYIQDDYQITTNLKVTGGLRFDIPFFSDRPTNTDFNSRTIPNLQAAGKNLRGAEVGGTIDTQVYFSPRFGFNWDINGDKMTVLRGGIGVFLSRMPMVWYAGSYNNTGTTVGGDAYFGGINFEPNVNNQPQRVAAGSGGLSGQIDLYSQDFKLPQRLKISLGFDKVLDSGWKFSIDGLFNDVIQDFAYQGLHIGNAVGRLNGADDRLYYDRRSPLDDTYGRIILVYNTDKGYSYNVGLTASKKWTSGLDFSASYSYGDSYAIFEQTSSQNSSNWRGQLHVNGRNSALPVARTRFSQGHRIISSVSYAIDWNDNLKTSIGLFYEGRQGLPYSFTYRGRLANDDSRTDRALLYVPRNASEITLEDPNNWEALNSFIENNDYLSERRGDYAQKNTLMGPWSDIIDFRIAQDIKVQKNTLQVTLDIFNFSNFVNNSWGRKFNVGSGGRVYPLTVRSGAPDPIYSWNDGSDNYRINEDNNIGSRWVGQLGIRYTFK